MRGEDVFNAYERHASAVDDEFQRVSMKFGARMQCGRGCSMCCSQMFSISLIEAAYISRAVKAMPAAEREFLRAAATEYAARAKQLTGNAPQEETITPRPGLRLACPALQGDACSIYAARPLICRKWGIPIFNPTKPLELQACELNFKPGEEIDVDGIVEPQAALLEQWVELKDRAGRTLHPPKVTATVAEAILVDFEAVLLGEPT